MNYEIIGMLATLIVLLSFTRDSIKQVRIINILGGAVFVLYGILIGAPSVYVLNGALIGVHVHKLYKAEGNQ